MKHRPKGLIEEFHTKEDKRVVFQLIQDQNGMYVIKRGTSIILKIQDKEKAHKGFKTLRDKWDKE